MITEISNGYIIDVETGEVIDHAEVNTGRASADDFFATLDPRPVFEATDLAGVEWVMSKLQEAESEVLGLKSRRDAIVSNIDTQIRDRQNKIQWLHKRFDADLELFTRSQIQDKKTKTVTTPFGKLSMRQNPGSIVVKDDAGAIAWAKQHMPEAVATKEHILLTPLDKVKGGLPGDLFLVIAPFEKFGVNTGVK